MWDSPVIIFEDEDEEALKTRFCDLSARYPDYSVFEIAQEVFRGLRDPSSRANQAGIVWGNSLEIKERIARLKRGDSFDVGAYTKEKWQAEVLAVARDVTLNAKDKKSTIDGLNLYAQSQGWLAKPSDMAKANGERKRVPSFVIKKYDDAA